MPTADPFPVPPGWRRSLRDGVVTATRPGSPPARLELRPGLPPSYDRRWVEDEDDVDLDGRDAVYRRIGHRVDGVEMVTEEWSWEGDAGPLVLSGTVVREDYLSVCDVFEEAAWGVSA